MASALSLVVLCVLFTFIESHIIKTDRVEVPPEGLTLKVIIKPDHDGKMLVQVKSVDNKPRLRTVEREPEFEQYQKRHKGHKKPISPTIENRFGIGAGVCPDGYTSRGGYCFPDYD